jgi:hypothetical protein
MQRVSGANFLVNGAGAGKNTYQDYNPATGQAGTTPNAAALTAMQEEITSLIEWQGLVLNPADNTQLRQAIIAYVASRTSTYETVAAATSSLAAAVAGLDNPAEVSAAIAAALATYAPLASPALTGTPTAPTAAPGTNTTQIATMAALHAALLVGQVNSYASNANGMAIGIMIGGTQYYLQFAVGSAVNVNGTQTVNFPVPFANAGAFCFPTLNTSGSFYSNGTPSIQTSGAATTGGIAVFIQSGGGLDGSTTPYVIAFGS